jgi:hypothetical protein
MLQNQWVLDAGYRIQDTGYRMLDTWIKILQIGRLNIDCCVLSILFHFLVKNSLFLVRYLLTTRGTMLDAGYWIQDTGYRMLDTWIKILQI